MKVNCDIFRIDLAYSIYSASNFTETLPAANRKNYNDLKTSKIDAFQDIDAKTMRREQLKQLKKKQYERLRDFKRRIDDTYKKAYEDDVANRNDPKNNNVTRRTQEVNFPKRSLDGTREHITGKTITKRNV